MKILSEILYLITFIMYSTTIYFLFQIKLSLSLDKNLLPIILSLISSIFLALSMILSKKSKYSYISIIIPILFLFLTNNFILFLFLLSYSIPIIFKKENYLKLSSIVFTLSIFSFYYFLKPYLIGHYVKVYFGNFTVKYIEPLSKSYLENYISQTLERQIEIFKAGYESAIYEVYKYTYDEKLVNYLLEKENEYLNETKEKLKEHVKTYVNSSIEYTKQFIYDILEKNNIFFFIILLTVLLSLLSIYNSLISLFVYIFKKIKL